MDQKPRFLMCPPDFFGVSYVINPWMAGNVDKVAPARARRQWNKLRTIVSCHAEVEQVTPSAGLPDMVFTANAGLVVDREVVLSRFYHPQRRGEEELFAQWFRARGYALHELPPDLPFEGAGDALLDKACPRLWAAYGFRTELAAHARLVELLAVEVVSLRLVDERFYHLDTCFCPLQDGFLMYYPAAFDAYSRGVIEARVPAGKRIVVSEADALDFACNAIDIEKFIVLNKASGRLRDHLMDAGFTVEETPMDEFMKAGGSAKCLVLNLTEALPKAMGAPCDIVPAVESRVVEFDGHLLDSGTLGRSLDAIVESGGSFQILQFQLGEQRQSTSHARIKVSAPVREVLDKIMPRLIELGARAVDADSTADARIEIVAREGVAPLDFYATTIYPTEVRIDGQWMKAQGQRMDAVIAVGQEKDRPLARCVLLRDLHVGERVVTGSEGIRIVRPKEERPRPSDLAEEFSFMGAGVSSERRVELVVENIAWELRRIRRRGGRTVVVAGPVVIHTGGGEHLAALIRQGYVSALLGGNAIAVHDIEQALFGTSLGVDLQHGGAVRGGHRHHLKAINRVRHCGGIAEAVEAGVLTRGIFHECVRNKVPFCLAGSIRDDGPLPDTLMDLIAAQAEYARLLRGADMVLMLASMLHSIGVGNMTPAGVKLVCVDINPAVVTKLSDRGSLESVGVVTDVGLFLSLLVRHLEKFEVAEPEAEAVYAQSETNAGGNR